MTRIITTVGLATGGAAAAAFLSMGAAAAAPNGPGYNTDPNPFGLTASDVADITGQTGSPLMNIASGTQDFTFNSNDVAPFIQAFLEKHVTLDGQAIDFDENNPWQFAANDLNIINKLEFYGSEQQIIFPGIEGTNVDWGVTDIRNFGDLFGLGNFGYVYIDLVGAGDVGPTDDAIGAWYTTPWGAFDVSWLEDGSVFGIPYMESQLFDMSDFNPGAEWADLTTVPSLLDMFS